MLRDIELIHPLFVLVLRNTLNVSLANCYLWRGYVQTLINELAVILHVMLKLAHVSHSCVQSRCRQYEPYC